MFTRVFAWLIVAVVLAGVWHWGGGWSNPWSPRSPVLSVLPVAAPGCGEDCPK
jgi:hypothetical protein